MKRLFFWPAILVSIFLLHSCGITLKNTTYFKSINKDTVLQGFITNDFESKIVQKDVLGITVSSLNAEMDQRFNSAASIVNPQSSHPGYVVDEKGLIRLHLLDTMKAEGFTRRELKEKIEKGLLPYMKDPIVNIQYLNHKVTILGEVVKPQVINMPNDQMTLIDVIVNSGDVKENANKKSIMVIREEKDTKKVKYINLEDASIFSSPWYYVQPNDIIYVMPDSERYIKEETRRRRQATFTFAASLISLVVVVLNFLIN